MESMYSIQELIEGSVNVCCYKYREHYYLFDLYNRIPLEVTPKLYECVTILKCSSELKEQDIYKKYEAELTFLTESYRRNLLLNTKKISESPTDYVSLCFTPGHQCNFKCRYCFAQGGETYTDEKNVFDVDDIVKTLDCFFTKIYPDARRYRVDFVSGGEPLLYFDIIKHVVEYSENFQKISGKSVQIWLCTNGSLLTSEIIQFFDKHNISIGISLDGNRESHNSNRVYSNGEGTYDDVLAGIRTLLDEPNVNNKVKSFWGLSVLNESNKDLISIVKHYKDLGIKTAQIKIEWRHFITDKDTQRYYDLLKESYERFADFLLFEYEKGNIEFILMITNENDHFGKMLKRFLTGIYVSRRCEAGRNKITIGPNGDIYPCYSFVGIGEMRLGNINYSPDIKGIFNEVGVNCENNYCYFCADKYLCGGDCYYDSYLNSNQLVQPQKYYCQFQKELLSIAIWLVCEMQKTNIELFKIMEREVILNGKVRQQ